MKQSLIRLYIFILLIHSVDLTFSQPRNVKFEHITTEDGLSSNVVYHVMQDRRGFMWFATNNGLCRFDGYSYKVFKYSPLDTNCVSSNWIIKLYEDRTGNIWIGTKYGGLNRFDPTTERFTHFTHDPDNPNSISCRFVFSICEDSSGALWLGTSNGLYKLVIKIDTNTNEETFVTTHYQHDCQNFNSLSNDRIWHLYMDKSNILWISTQDSGLNRFDIKKEEFTHYKSDPANPNSISSNRVRYVYEDPLGNSEILWVGTLGGLNKFNKKTERFIRYLHDPNNIKSLSDNGVITIYRDSKGNLWIGTRRGLNIFDGRNEIFRRYKHDPSDANSTDFFYSICEDRSGVLWFGTIAEGVKKLSSERKKFATYEGWSKNHKFKELQNVFSIYEDRDGVVWFGTDKGLNKFDRVNEIMIQYEHDPGDKNSLIHNKVYSIYEDFHYVDKTLWIACYGGGLDRLKIVKNEKSGEEIVSFEHFTHDPLDSNSISSRWVDKIFKDKNGNLWIATAEGLNQFDYSKEIFYRYEHDPDDPITISHNQVTVIYQSPHDSSNILWIGTADGLNKFDTDKNIFKHYKNDPADSNSLSHNIIQTICGGLNDENNELWIGTFDGGLNRFDIDKEKFTHFTDKDGLNSNTIYSIVEDKNGYLWLSTGMGISRFDPQSQTFRNYTNDDGVFECLHYHGSHFKSKSDEIFFSGSSGFLAFYPDSIKDNPHVPPIVIIDFKVFDKPVKFNKSITSTKNINLSYKQNFFSFEFAALDYTNPAKNQYAYKLEGVDNDWIYCGNRRYANYTNINPGEYLFRVKGTNNDGVWNEEGTALKLIITPPFWMRTWFRFLIGITLIASLVAIYKIRISMLEKEKKSQQAFSRRLIEEVEKGRKRIAGVLHDSLGQNLLIMKNEIDRSILTPGLQTQHSENLKEISGLISESINDVRQISYDLHPHQLDRLGLTKAIKSMITKFIKSSEIHVTHEVDEIDDLFSNEMEIHIYRIIQEGLNNIIKHADANHVILKVKKSNKAINISIQDDGKGFDYKKYKTDHTQSKGLGLVNIAEQVKILNGSLNINTALKKGARLLITVPKEKSG